MPLFDAETFFVDPDKDYWTEYTGPGGKFHHEDEAEIKRAFGRSKAEADAHIARIEDEQKRLREELATRIKYEEFLDKISSAPMLSNQEPPVRGEPAPATTAMSPEELERLLELKIQQREQAKVADQNLNISTAKLQEVFGPNYSQHLRKQAQDLDVSEQFLRNLASSNPKAFFKLIGVEDKPKADLFQAPPRNQTTFIPNTSSTKRGDAYYEEIRKRDPNLYWTSKIQNEIFNQVKELGADVYYSS